MGISANPATSKLYKRITELEKEHTDMELKINFIEQETVKLECDQLRLNHMQKSQTQQITDIKFNTQIIREELAKVDKILDENEKVAFTKASSKQVLNLGLIVWDGQRKEAKEQKVDMIFEKRKELVEIEQECSKVQKALRQMARSSQEGKFKQYKVRDQSNHPF